MQICKNRGKVSMAALFLLILSLIYGIMRRDRVAAPAFFVASEPILILDAGHGGADGGAVSSAGLLESSVNLDIVLRMRELCRLLAVPCLLTRDTEELDYPPEANTIAEMKRWDTRQRVDYVNHQGNAVLFSIHQNFYPASSPKGPQIFYSSKGTLEKTAEQIQFYMTKNLYPANRRLAAPIPKGIYIPEHVNCPTILCECGFLSNDDEAELLSTPEYRTKIALILMGAYLLSSEENL